MWLETEAQRVIQMLMTTTGNRSGATKFVPPVGADVKSIVVTL